LRILEHPIRAYPRDQRENHILCFLRCLLTNPITPLYRLAVLPGSSAFRQRHWFLPGFGLANASDLHEMSAMYTRAQLCALPGLVLAAAPVMYASTLTYTWTGASDSNFHRAGNWSLEASLVVGG
jgi:hypothetical protein